MRDNFYTGRKLAFDRFVSPVLFTAAVHALMFALSGVSAFLLRLEFSIDPRYTVHVLWAVGIWVTVKSIVFHKARLNQIWSSHTSVSDVIGISVGNCIGSVVSGLLIAIVSPPGFPRSVYLIDFLICLLGTVGLRVVYRIAHEKTRSTNGDHEIKRAFIYGAGDAGVMLLREIRSNPASRYEICGFLDDNPRKIGMLVHRVPVVGQGCQLPVLARTHNVHEVVIAIPSASGPQVARMLQSCHDAGVSCKTMPSLSDWVEGAGAAGQIRDVAVEDLLGRSPVHLDQEQIREKLQNRVVMVTGAAGSIGSELCRQIARFRPKAIIGFEIAETPAFFLEDEMRSTFPNIGFYPEIGSIQNLQRLREVMRLHQPSVVYHAAAYKHVPLMEKHVTEAVENNVFGTWNVATAAAEIGVEEFVMISSDKAVHPTSVMGTTKRIAEMLIWSLQNTGTKYVSVRFGNVLGSNGSVVPIFKKQIAAGGPVTVTHPDMQRYFMTIPEAAQLVLQASTMGNGNEIFVLDMGQPVKIVDLARNLILLSGLRPDEDIKIHFSGSRPGEKLYEEINSLNEDTIDTYHEKIKIFMGNGVPHDFSERLQNLRRLCESRDIGGLVVELKEILPDYNPGSHMLRYLLTHSPEGHKAGSVRNYAATV
jgi:FlaA1/EpsC-like NDP-sugar epimerase